MRYNKICVWLQNEAKTGKTTTGKNFGPAYKQQIAQYGKWCEEHIGRRASPEEAHARVQDYLNELKSTKAPATVKTACAALSAVFHDTMSKYDIGSVSAVSSKGRSGDFARSANAARPVEFNQLVGIRQDEVRHQLGRDFVRDPARNCAWVHVERGKGGKEQWQYIRPELVERVAKFYEGKQPNERIFSQVEQNASRHANLHECRRSAAQSAYRYYCSLDSKSRDELRQLVEHRFRETGNGRKWDGYDYTDRQGNRRHHIGVGEHLDRPYVCRGPVREAMLAAGRPVEYDRLAIIAVSVLDLSHWREDVTVSHYMV